MPEPFIATRVLDWCAGMDAVSGVPAAAGGVS